MNTYKTSSERMAEVVAKARRRWQNQQRMPEPAEALSPPAPRAFTIAISREAGANGSAVGRLLGERVGWPVYDYELVERIAGDIGLRSELLESVDEKRMSWLQEFAESFASESAVTESAYVRHPDSRSIPVPRSSSTCFTEWRSKHASESSQTYLSGQARSVDAQYSRRLPAPFPLRGHL
jgi:hypothetical protein